MTQAEQLLQQAEQLRRIENKLDSVVTKVTTLNVRCEPCQKKVDEHDRALYGRNSNVGLIANVKMIEESRKRQARRERGIISTLAVALSAATAAIIKWITG